MTGAVGSIDGSSGSDSGSESGPSRGLAARLIPAYAVALAVVAWTSGYSPISLPKVALNLVVIGPGLAALVLLILARDRAAWWAGGFLGAAGLATLLADRPLMSFTGSYSLLNGWLLVAVCVGVWALGRRTRGIAVRLELALIVGASVNAAAAWLASSGWSNAVLLRLSEGRPTGLMPNPVFLGSVCAAAAWLVLVRDRDSTRPGGWLLVLGLLLGAVELSGTRSAEIVAVLCVAWFVLRWLRARAYLRALALVAAVAAGFLLAQLPTGSADSGSSRLSTAATSGLSTRLESWGDALDAVGERPVLGYGPGRTYVALSPRRSAEIARSEGPDLLYFDAHNVVVEVLTTTGVLGLGAFLGWMWCATRKARGPLVGFAAVGAAMMLLEPVSHGFAPLVLLALGAAAPRWPPRGERSPAESWVRVVGGVLAGVGALAGVALLVGDAAYLETVRDPRPASLAPAQRWWPAWPDVALRDAQLLSLDAQRSGDPAGRSAAFAAAREARRRDPAMPFTWEEIGLLETVWGSPARARTAYLGALERNPWSSQALQALMQAELQAGNRKAAARYRRALCEVAPLRCAR